MDIGVLADTLRGVSLVSAPSLRTPQGRQNTKITWLRFPPDSLLGWLDTAYVYLRVPVRANEPDGTRWAPPLKVVGGQGWLTFGRRIHKHRLAKQRYALLADSANKWSFEASEEQVDGLLNLLLDAALLSRLAPSDPRSKPGAICEDPDRPVAIEHQPPIYAPGITGRVAMQYVVDATGRAEMDTFVALFATAPALEKAARAIVEESRFRPAMRRGQPVRQLVQQVGVWP